MNTNLVGLSKLPLGRQWVCGCLSYVPLCCHEMNWWTLLGLCQWPLEIWTNSPPAWNQGMYVWMFVCMDGWIQVYQQQSKMRNWDFNAVSLLPLLPCPFFFIICHPTVVNMTLKIFPRPCIDHLGSACFFVFVLFYFEDESSSNLKNI